MRIFNRPLNDHADSGTRSSRRRERTGRGRLAAAWSLELLPVILLSSFNAGAVRADTPPSDYERAVALSNSGDHLQSKNLLLQMLEKDPDDVRVADHLVAEYLRLKDISSGVAFVSKLSKEHPKSTAPVGALAALCEAGGQYDDARRYWMQTIRMGSRRPEHLYGLMGAFQRDHMQDRSEAVLDSLSALTPGSAVLLYARGIRAWLMHDLNAATDWLQKAIAADPNLFDAAITLGDIQFRNLAPNATYRTWTAGLERATAIGDREIEFEFLDRLGEAYWNAMDPQCIPVLEEAIPLGEQLGMAVQVETMRTRLMQVELTEGHLDRAEWWGREAAQRTLDRGDSALAASKLTFLGGSLDIAGEPWTALGMYERAFRLAPLKAGSGKMITPAVRMAYLLLRLGDFESSRKRATQIQSILGSLPRDKVPEYDSMFNTMILGHLAYLTGQPARADSFYRAVIARPASGMSMYVKGEADICLARIKRETGDLAGARAALDRAAVDLAVSKDSILIGMADAEAMALLSASGDKEGLSKRAQSILSRSGNVLPRGLQPQAALYLARLALPNHAEEGLNYLLKAWLLSEREREQQANIPPVEGLLPDPEEPLERLALFFAQMAVRPGDAPGWTWKPAKDTSHVPGTPAGILAARWSYFFAERRAARIMEYNLTAGYGGPLPPQAPASRIQLWEQVADRARAQGLALIKGKLPGGAPQPDQPLIKDLTDGVRDGVIHGVPDYARVPWLIAPSETCDLEHALQASHETIVRAACLQPMSLLYILTQDRIRIVPVPMDRATLAQKIQKWVPYRALGCATPGLETLPTNFDVAGELFNELLGPVGETADLSHTIWIAADGPLWYLPFESLSPHGGQPTSPDSSAVLLQQGRMPIALDQYRIAYLLDPGALLAGAGTAGSGGAAGAAGATGNEGAAGAAGSDLAAVSDSVRFVEPLFHGDGPPPGASQIDACILRSNATMDSWRRPPCEPQADDLTRLLHEALSGIRVTRKEGELAQLAPVATTVFFCPLFTYTTHPWEGGLLIGGEPDRQEDGFLRWPELARLHGGGCLILPEAPACGSNPDLAALTPSHWGSDIFTPALGAAFAGYHSMVQANWNAGEAVWIPLAGCLHTPGGPIVDGYLAERQHLRAAKIPAGHGHDLALGHPFFSCATRWWQLAPPARN